MDEKKEFRVIIAGGRDYCNYPQLRDTCDYLLSEKAKTSRIVIVSGGATGADALGERYARERGYELRRFPADWQTHGKAAGPIRNRQMAENANALIAFWDDQSRGTRNMIQEAHEHGLVVRVAHIGYSPIRLDDAPGLRRVEAPQLSYQEAQQRPQRLGFHR